MSLPPADLGSWFLAGFGDGDGNIGRSALDFEVWSAPHTVWVADNRLYWQDADVLEDGSRRWPSARAKAVNVEPDLLGRFVDTWDDETGEAISDFAATFGVLQLCDRGLPPGHRASLYGSSPGGEHESCYPTGFPAGEPYVDLDAWRLWARRALALLTITAKLQVSELPDAEHWTAQAIWTPPGRDGGPNWQRAVDVERLIAAHLINEWLTLGQVRLSARWEPDALTPTTRAVGQGLFGALAMQLLLTTARSEGLAICSSCGLPYAPSRKPPAGKDHYCPSCGKQAARREASRRWRAKKRAEKGDH